MANFFGARDYGDPRHNLVPMIMEQEKRTGKVLVPSLWTPREFPGQVSYPVLYSDRIPGINGVRRGRYDRRFVPSGSQSAHAMLQHHKRSAVQTDVPSTPPPPPPLMAREERPASARKNVSFDPETPPPTDTARSSSRSSRMRSRSLSTRPPLKPLNMLPDMDAFTAAGVTELVKLGFSPQAAFAAFSRMSGKHKTAKAPEGAALQNAGEAEDEESSAAAHEEERKSATHADVPRRSTKARPPVAAATKRPVGRGDVVQWI